MFAFVCIINALVNFRRYNYRNRKWYTTQMRYPRYWFQFNWSAAYAPCVLKLGYNQNVLSLYKVKMPNFKSRAHFSVTPISLNDDNVRGGNVIKPLTREMGTGQKFVSI